MADQAIPVPNGEELSRIPVQKLRTRPTKTLPTDRITFGNQLQILRAYGTLSGPAGGSVSNTEVADAMKMQPSTVSLANPFFNSVGLIQKTENGGVPSSWVMEMIRAKEWTPETATHKLAPAFRDSWFGQALLPKISFSPMSEDAAIAKLAEACSASPDYKAQLRMLIEYLIVAGLLDREGDQLRSARNDSPVAPTTTLPEPARPPERESRANISTGFAQTPEGAVNFHISIRVEMAEFAGWQPQRIAAFFNGIAAVLAAKASVEQKG